LCPILFVNLTNKIIIN